MDNFKKLLLEEAKYQLPDEPMHLFISKMQPLYFKKGEIVVETGEVNPDIYIVKEGICAYTYLNGYDLHCHAFAMPPHAYLQFNPINPKGDDAAQSRIIAFQ